MSTWSVIGERFSTGRRLAMIWSVASLRENCRRSACERSTATCLNDWISSPARCRLATSCCEASREDCTNSSSCERRRPPSPLSWASKISVRRAKLDATVRLMPIGLLTSCATPATRPPSAASRLGVDQILLRGVELEQRALGLLLGRAQLVLGLALRDRVLAEHLDRARHGADLVACLGALHLAVEVAERDRAHRGHDLLQRQPDRQRDQHAGGEDDAEEDHRDGQHPPRDIGQRAVERLLRLLLALAHLGGEIVDGADRLGLVGVDGVAQQLGAVRELLGELCEALAQRHGAGPRAVAAPCAAGRCRRDRS